MRIETVRSPGQCASELILLVESDAELGRELAEQLAADGYRTIIAHTAEHARTLACHSPPGLVVLGDLGSPRGALDLLEAIRLANRPDGPWADGVPVIMVCTHAGELDIVRGLERGADDFLARPASYLELRARLRAILRRSGNVRNDQRAVRVGPLTIEPRVRSAWLHGEMLELRPLEFELLLHLAFEPDRVFSKKELMRAVWGYAASGSTRTVDSHASRVRRKLEARCPQRWVINVWGVGYRLT
jgi:DNA-binding response OmpR family regulator